MKLLSALTLIAVGLLAPAAAANASNDDVLAKLRPGHPRLLFNDEQLAAAIAAAKTDAFRAKVHQNIIAAATAELTSTPIKHELIGPRLLDKSRTCVGRVLTCALAYRLTGDTRFADRAKREMLTAAAFKDWNPSHFLDVAEMSFALAIGYDWLHGQLSASERDTIRRALLEKALVFAPDAYAPGGPQNKQLWFVSAHHNWNQVCNGGLLAAALALADEQPELARTVVKGAVQSLPLAMAAYQPDGAYPEGPGYWGYGTSYNVLAIALCESALGTDLGLTSIPGFNLTARYRLYVQAPTGLGFNYADSDAGLGAQPEYTWLAQRYHEPAALAHSRQLLEAQMGRRSNSRFLTLHAIWYPEQPATPAPALPLDAKFRGPAEVAMLRSAWNDPRALFVGFKAGRNDVNHSHLDLGSFVLEADQIRWSEDLGKDDYNLPDYFDTKSKRWQYYRLNNLSHSTLTPDGKLQDPKGVAPITSFSSTPARAFVVADLTKAYPGTATRLTRGVALLDRARVLVQDEGTGLKKGTSWSWRLITGAKVSVDDPRHATLTKDGRTLKAEILAPAAATFSARPAKPPTAKEVQNKGVTVLQADCTADGDNTRLAILLTPVGDHWPQNLPAPQVTALSDWK